MNTTIKELNKKTINECDGERYFNEINISEKFKFSEYIDNKYMKFKSASLHLQSIKLINTIQCISYEGQKVRGKKLILCGYLDTSFYIDYGFKCFYIRKDIPLSTFIIVPGNSDEEEDYKINYCIEDVTIVNIECDYVFISVTLFLEYINKLKA